MAHSVGELESFPAHPGSGGAQRSLADMFGRTASTGRASVAGAAAAAGPHNPNGKRSFGGRRTRPAMHARSRASLDGSPGSRPDSPDLSEESQEEDAPGEGPPRMVKLVPIGHALPREHADEARSRTEGSRLQ